MKSTSSEKRKWVKDLSVMKNMYLNLLYYVYQLN